MKVVSLQMIRGTNEIRAAAKTSRGIFLHVLSLLHLPTVMSLHRTDHAFPLDIIWTASEQSGTTRECSAQKASQVISGEPLAESSDSS